ncbi:hypothetical protein HXX76_004290 [Chlamydomonas incerta]|uniref:Non-specific serine/threonine protein kinase n=1 Tax=Chlamydomonas incerta TaxID=51695 RepID=A0A835TAN1_CHLIN|nr:hypothetical protein HXX76_004290 [Chlamydomonas incerta]|eukprot:KAG2440177.1 hypothetical protein HXX76_004290 [Chlamydomonas incerta]
MSLAADSGLTASPSPGSVRSLQALPEVLSPVRHGFLWKRSRAFKAWLSRWFQLDDTGFTYAASPKLIKREGRYVLPSAVREVLPLPPERYRNGATMYGVRVVATSGATKDLYTDDAAALEAWTRDLARSTPAARQAAYRKALLAAPPAGAPPLPPSRRPGGGASLNELHLGDICEVDWSGMLGSGLFACVLRGRLHEGGEAVAVKIIKKEAMAEYSEIVYREAQVWSAVGQHPHICQLKQVLRSSARMYFIAELCDGGGLVERLAASATYCEREVAWLMRQLLAAVAHLHQNAIVHMDIKPENVVFATRREDSLIKLIDFSLAAFIYTPTDPGGTPDFVAPELLNEPDVMSKNGCGPEVDMWALGVMLFFLLSGQTPFQSANLETVMARVKSGEWNFHGRRWALVSEGARDLVSRLLRREPSQRLTAEEALGHPWLNRPEALSQALLQDAITSFRAAAAAQQQQMRTSWIKQGSGELTGSHATGTGIAAVHSNHLSPHASLNRQAMMQAMAGAGSNAPPAALLSTGGLVRNLMGTHPGMDPAAVMSALVSDRPGSPLIRASPSQSVMLAGGPSGRASRATGHNSNSPSMPAAVAAAAAAAAASGARGGSRNHSFSVGGGGPAHMSRMGAGGLASGPMPAAGGLGSGSLTAAMAVARSSAGSPHGSPHPSPQQSAAGAVGGAGCSPRSPLGMRTRRASDTMAYAISLTERQESFTQMHAQGLAAPPNAGMQWPAAMAISGSKARRASDVHSYGLMPYSSASQAELGSAAAVAGHPSAADGAGGAAGLAGAAGHSLPGLPPAGAGSSFGLRGSQQRGASGLSIMTNPSTSAAAAAAAAAAMRAGGRSNPELLGNRHTTSSAGAQSNNGSSSELTPPTPSRDAGVASGPAALLVAAPGAASSSSRGGNASLLPPPPPSQSQVHLQSSPSAPPPQAAGEKEKRYDAGGGDRALSRASLSNAQARFAQLAGKSQSYHTIPSAWVMDAQAPPPANVRPLSGAHGYGLAAGGGSVGSAHPSMAAMLAGGAGGGSARGASPSGLPGGGGAGAGGGGSGVPSVALQRRASMSFTAGTSMSGLAGLHGPSPLSNSSAGRIFPPGTLVAAAAGAGNSMHGAGSQPPSGTVAFAAGAGGGSSTGGGAPPVARPLSRTGSGASTPLAPSPSHSQSNVPFHAFGAGGGGSGAGGSGVSAAPGAPGSTSMYAAVLRSNLSGHALMSSSGAEGGGGGGRRATGTGGGSGASTPRSCGSPQVSGTQAHVMDVGGPTVSQATAAVAGSMLRTTSSGSLSGAAAVRSRSLRGMTGGGMAPGAAPGAQSLRANSGNTQQLMEQVVLGPLLISSGSNVGVTGSSAAGGAGFVDHASALGSGSVAGAGSGAPSGAREHPAAAGGPVASNGGGAGAGCAAMAVLLADGSSALRPAAWTSDIAEAALRERVLAEPLPGVAHAGSASAADGAADGSQVARFASAPHAGAVELGGGGGGGGGSAGGSPSGAAAAAAAAAGARAAPSIVEMLRGNALGLRASSRLVLETIPSEDPESLSGLLRSVREDRAAGGGPGAAGGTSISRTSGGNVGALATHALIISAANLPSGPISSTAISLGPISGPPGPAGGRAGAELSGGGLASLIQLPSMPSEPSDEAVVGSLRLGVGASDAARPAATIGRGAPAAAAAAAVAAAMLVVPPPQDAASSRTPPRESPASSAAGAVRAGTTVSSRSGSVLHRATSALGAGSLHSGGSGFNGAASGGGDGLGSAPHRSTSLNEEALRRSEGGASGDRSSGGSGHSGFSRHSQGSATGASPLGSPVGGRGNGGNSGGSGSGRHVRRATTAINLRLHATTAAAAQAAAAAEKAALAAESADALLATAARAPHSPNAAARAPHSPTASTRAPLSPTTGSSPRAAASKPPATKTVKEENSSSSESGSDGKPEAEAEAEADTPGKPDPFAHWDWPPPAPAPLVPRAPAGAGHRQRAASAVGLSGASLAALLAQAAPLAQAAQASAAAQIESIYSSSGGGSFTSQRAHGHYGPPGSIRAAGLMAGLGHGSEGLGTGSGAPGTPYYPGDDGSAGAGGGGGVGSRFLGSGQGGVGTPGRAVRRAVTSSNMGMLVHPVSGGIAPAMDEDAPFAHNAAAAAAALHGPGVAGGGSMSQVVMPTVTSGGGFAGSGGGGGGGSMGMGRGGGTSLHGQASVPVAMTATGSLSGADSPVQPLKTRTSAAAVGGGGTLAALLAQAAPLAAAAQANAAAQTAARMASNSSNASMSPAAVPYGVRAATGSGPSTPTGQNTLAAAGGGYGGAYFGPPPGQGVGSGSGASAGSYEAPASSWARRRSSTSKDLRDRAAASYLPAGGSAVHRLGQNPPGAFAGLAAAGGSSGGTGSGVGMGGGLALGGGSIGGVPDLRVLGPVGGAVGGVQPRLSQSPPREQGSPGGASVSSAGRLSTYPAVPSRLSHSGTGTNTPRIVGAPGAAAAASTAGAVAGAMAGAMAGAGGSGVLLGAQSPALSPQSSLNRLATVASSSSMAGGGNAAANGSSSGAGASGGGGGGGGAAMLPQSLSLPTGAAASSQAAAAAQIAQLTQLHHLQNHLHQQSQLRVRTNSRSGSNAAFAPAPTAGAVSATGVGTGVGTSRLNGDRLLGRGTSSGGVSPSHSAMQLGGAAGNSVSGAAAIPGLDKDKLIEAMEKEIKTLHGQLGAGRLSNASSPLHSRMSGGGGSAQQLRTQQQ